MHRLIEEGAHPCVAGLLTDSMVKLVTRQGQDFIAEVDFILGQGTLRPYVIRGQLIMIPAETYDMVVFSLLREMYGLGFPKLMIVNFTNFEPLIVDGQPMALDNAKFIVSKRFNDRKLRMKDYYPVTAKNYQFRYRLCLLIYFCKFVGVDFDLSYVRVINNDNKDKVPFMWRVGALGGRNAKTVDAKHFALLFGIDLDAVMKIYAGQRQKHNEESPPLSNHSSDKRVEIFNRQLNLLQNPHYVKVNRFDSSKLKLTSDHPDPIVRNIVNKLRGLVGEKSKIEELIEKTAKTLTEVNFSHANEFDGSNQQLKSNELIETSSNTFALSTDACLTEARPKDVDYEQFKGSMFEQVVTYFREVDFDTDILRACVYLRENPVRSARGNRCKFKLARGPDIVQKIIEENYVLLTSPYPFKIFRLR